MHPPQPAKSVAVLLHPRGLRRVSLHVTCLTRTSHRPYKHAFCTVRWIMVHRVLYAQITPKTSGYRCLFFLACRCGCVHLYGAIEGHHLAGTMHPLGHLPRRSIRENHRTATVQISSTLARTDRFWHNIPTLNLQRYGCCLPASYQG